MNYDEKVEYLKKATASFELEKKHATACREHATKCWTCRFLSFFFRCLTLENLLFECKIAKDHADDYRTGVTLIQNEPLEAPQEVDGVHVPTTISADWLETLYKL